MKRTHISLLTIIILTVVGYEYLNNHWKVPQLSGEYDIVGVSRAENMSWQEFDSLGYWNLGAQHFTFIDKLRLDVNQELSELLFDGHQKFNYHFLNDQLLLVSLNDLKTFLFTYEKNGSGIDLIWDHPRLVGLQLMPSDQLGNATSQNLRKD